ncbi:hypothetical protein [Okeania sp. KiyG1]|uniref:hypothetical protein n=1 Tax=Okeania sp. KiyG1 TaxID=2720165 RepID=UPI0019210CB6|nr:hypothetical protein [Okeania sp. KiyG1]GGA13916.1 hypothetical protein CYANOKiyG1_27430 [Okeania sp. KiyG1]
MELLATRDRAKADMYLRTLAGIVTCWVKVEGKTFRIVKTYEQSIKEKNRGIIEMKKNAKSSEAAISKMAELYSISEKEIVDFLEKTGTYVIESFYETVLFRCECGPYAMVLCLGKDEEDIELVPTIEILGKWVFFSRVAIAIANAYCMFEEHAFVDIFSVYAKTGKLTEFMRNKGVSHAVEQLFSQQYRDN